MISQVLRKVFESASKLFATPRNLKINNFVFRRARGSYAGR